MESFKKFINTSKPKMNITQFGSWNENIHSENDQQKRINSAQKANCTPLSINRENESGQFQGSSGSYETSLTTCSCFDFSHRKKPCKHMYRLAMELDYIQCNFESDSSKISVPKKKGIQLKDAAMVIDQLPVESQMLLQNIIYDIKYKKQVRASVEINDNLNSLIDAGILVVDYDAHDLLRGYRRNELNARIDTLHVEFKKNMKLDDLIDWCINNIKDEISKICSDRTTVVLSEQYQPTMHKIYKYLHRLYDSEIVFTENGEAIQVPYLSTNLPDDEVTSVLMMLGHYKE